MDLKILMTTFGMVFLAELGDKTQLATFCLSADCDPKLAVFLGSSLALVLSSLIAVIGGTLFSKILPPHYIKLAAGLFFVVVGAWMLISVGRSLPS